MPLDDLEYQDQLEQAQMGITPSQSFTPSAPSARTSTPYQAPVRERPAQIDDKFEYDESRPAFTFRPEEGTPEHGTYMSDYAKAAWNGARQMGADLMGAADFATRQLSADPTAQTVFRRAQASLESDIENSVKSMSPDAQKAIHASLFGNDPDAPSPGDVGWGRYLAINAASQVPMLLSFLIPSTIGAKVAIGAAKAMGAGERAIAAATAAGKSAEEIAAAGKLGGVGTAGGHAATAGFFGAQNAGAVYNDIVKQVTDASDKEMMSAPGYAAYRQQGMSVTEAKEQVIQKIAGFAVATAGLVGGVAGAGVGGLVRRGALGAIQSRVANAGIGAVEGGALMGGQGATNEALSQRTGQQLGTQQGYDPNKILAQAVSAGIPGALFGAAGGVFHKPEARGIDDTRDTGGVAGDQRAALDAALGTQGELDLTAAPSGIPVGQQQGELFRTPQEANPPLVKDATSPPMTGEPAPPPPPAPVAGGAGMPGARQGELPINQTPPGIVPTTGQGEMFPSVPEMNPPVPDARVPQPAQPMAEAGPVTGAPTTPVTGAAPVTSREPAGAAAPAEGRVDARVEVKDLPAAGKKRDEMIDELVGLTGRKPSSFKGQTTAQIAAVYNREMARQGAGTGAAVESTPPPAKLAAAKPIEQAAPVESKPAETPPVGELPLPDQPGGSLSPQAAVASAEPAAPAEAAPRPVEEKVTPGVTPEAGVEQKVEEKPPVAVKAPEAAKAIAVSKRAAQKARMQATGPEVRREPEKIFAAQATRDAALKEAEAARKQAAAEALALRRQQAAEQRELPIRTQDYGAKQEARPDTTDYERIQGELVDRIARGEISGADAHAEYEQGRRKGGRQRRAEFDTVAKGIERELATAQNKDVELALLKQQQEHEAKPKGTPKQREKRTNDLEEQLKHFDPTRIERLQAALKEIRDPVGHAADRASPLESTRGPKPAGIDPMGSRYTRLLRDPRLSNSITRALKQAHQDGIPLTLHNLLRTVSSDPLLRNEARPLVALAERFLKISRDIPVMSGEHAYDLGHIDAHTLARMERGGLTGHYHPTHEHIVLSMHRPEHTLTTLMHEASHSITQKLIDHMQRTDPSHPQLQALNTIRQEIHRAYEDSRNILGPETRDAIEYALNAGGRGEAVYHELHTALLTDPKVQGFVSSQQASPQFTTKMRALGYGIKPGRSVWQAFTGWMRKALGMPEHTSGSEATIFDHIMRPVSDITEHAAQYNERTRPRDAALERHAAPLERASRDYLRDAGRGIADRLDTKSIPDKLRSMVLQFTNRDATASYNSDILDFRNFIRADDKIAEANTKATRAYGDRVRGLRKVWGGLSDQKETGQLMNHATINEFHLGDNLPADANKHITDPEDQKALAAAQAQYDKLTPQAKDFYNKTKGLYNEFYKETREAELRGSLRSLIPDVTPQQEEEFVKASRNQKSLADFMADPDNSDIAKSFGTDWSKNRELSKLIAKSHSYGYTKGDYFPQRRYGEYVVRYGKDEQQGVEFFDKRSKAEDRRKELVKEYGDKDVWQVTKHNQKFTRDILANHPAVDELETALANRGFSGAQAEHARDTLASILLNHMSNNAAQKMRMKRRGVIGAETDQARVMSNEFLNHTARLGYLLHGAERQKAIADLWSQQHDLERPETGNASHAIRARDVIQSLEKRQMRPEEMTAAYQRGMANLNQFNFNLSLLSPSHIVTNTMETHGNSLALLAGRHGVFQSSKALASNLARLAPVMGKTPTAMIKAVQHDLNAAHWNVLQMLVDRLNKEPGANKALNQIKYDELSRMGIIDHSAISDLRRQANPEGMFSGKVANMWERVTDVNAILAHTTEALNKFVAYNTAFDLEMKKSKGDVEAAKAYAEKIVRRSAPNYASQNRELISSGQGLLGKFGAPLMQFKRYGLSQYALMAALMKESISKGTSAERWEARKSLAYLMATHAMMAGVLGLPTTDAIRYIGGAYDYISGQPGPRNRENAVRGMLTHAFGPTWGEAIARGLPHLLGIDIHRRTSLNNMIEMPDLKSFSKPDIAEAMAHLALGATGENATAILTGISKMMQGDIIGGGRALMPRIIADPIKAINLASQGVTDSRGHTILPPTKLSPYDIGLQAVGFQPSKVSETREKRNAILEARTEQGAERSKLEQRYLSGNASDKAAAWQAIVEYNSRNPTARITRQQLLQQQQAEKRSAGTMGLRLPKKGAAALMQVGAFANAP